MMSTVLLSTLAFCFSVLYPTVHADLTEQILSSVVYTRYGDRTPFILPQTPTLTPLGAQQLFSAGSAFRDRYLVVADNASQYSSVIGGIQPDILDNDQVTILSTSDQYVMASALAFMQGLYPPLEDQSPVILGIPSSQLANGTNVVAPLGGFQYPNIYTASPLDLNSIWVAGMDNCPQYTSSVTEYYGSPEYESLQQQTASFYASFEPGLLNGIFPNSSVGYFDAYGIWDYVNYAVTHNASAAASIDTGDLTRLRVLADDIVFAMNGNISASGLNPGDHIRSISGRTLATRILETLYTNINTNGQYNKLNLLFGSFEPMVAFLSLAGVPSLENQQFYGIPEPGSSLVIELFSLLEENDNIYPDVSNLFVRFLYQNGTGAESTLVAYPLFGLTPSQIIMSLNDFENMITNITIPSIASWCSTCSSYSVFCPAFDQQSGTSTTGPTTVANNRLSPVVAGVIGALVALVVAALLFGALMLIGGLRLSRRRRRSELGGFKGSKKLASDQDLTLPKDGAGAVVSETGAAEPKGHERVGSWELGSSAKAQEAQRPIDQAQDVPARPSFEDDDLHISPYANPAKPHEQV